ncbi:MAG: DUF4167 domain-containing protein [Hyphomicrobiales bacterium]|nr:DUF4167 domain-containing protein [Hyphomicrobiales bacterium]
MRPGQNKRMRGRNNNNNNNRRGPNPLSRSYESNGPDVKIRGNAQHVAEKYLQLARDAHTSGDPVAAESYLQHAEHYFRLIAAAQLAQQQAQAGVQRPDDEDEDDDETGGLPDRYSSPMERAAFNQQPTAGFGPQPGAPQGAPQAESNGQQPGFVAQQPQNQGQPQQDRPFQPRQERFQRQDRPFNQDRNQNRDGGQGGYRQDFRNDRNRPRNDRPNDRVWRDQPRDQRDVPPVDAPQPDLPAFITAPVRPVQANDAPAIESAAPAVAATDEASFAPPPGFEGEGEARFPLRGRRRKRRDGDDAVGAEAEGPAEG